MRALVFLIVLAVGHSARAAELRVGAAAVKITPPAGTPMAGYYHARAADGVHDDPAWDENSFGRTRDLVAANRMMPELRADRVAIGPFLSGGRKALLYQGWADPSTNADPTIEYYTRLAAAQAALGKEVASQA